MTLEKTKKNIVELTRMTLEEALNARKHSIVVVLDNVRSLHNVGSVLRTCDALGIEEVVMCGITGTPPHKEIEKTALGADKSVKWSYNESTLEEVKRRREEGWKIYALEQAHNSVNLNKWHRESSEKSVIVVGNEVEGVQQKIVDICDICLEIPQYGAKHSMNVSVSTGIALWQALKG